MCYKVEQRCTKVFGALELNNKVEREGNDSITGDAAFNRASKLTVRISNKVIVQQKTLYMPT